MNNQKYNLIVKTKIKNRWDLPSQNLVLQESKMAQSNTKFGNWVFVPRKSK